MVQGSGGVNSKATRISGAYTLDDERVDFRTGMAGCAWKTYHIGGLSG